tara:strand:- start:322 stop:594 length:273 start_codon:yes stop_codon:yes gene_type:complete
MKKKLTMEELIIEARNVEYTNPNKDYNEWSEDEFYMKSINVALGSYEQIQSLINICKFLPPLKLFVKQQLRNYIKLYTNKNCNNEINVKL